MDRRWETNDTGRRPIFSGPEGSGALRDLPDRPPARLAGSDRRDDRPPAPISGTNSIPVGGRSSGYGSDTSVSNAVRSPVDRYRPADNLGGLPRRPPPVEVDSYDRRGPPFPPPDLPPPGPTRVDRAGRRPSVGQDGLARARGGDPISDRPPSTLPPRPRDVPPRDNAPPRQSRVAPASGSGAAPITEPRIWQTRDEAQSARTQDVRPGDSRAPRDDIRPLHDWTSNNEPAAPRRWPVNDSYPPGPGAPEIPGPRTSPEVRLRNRPITPPPAGDGRRYETPLVEHPVAGKVHPERARLLAVDRSVPPEDSGRSGPAGTRRPGRSPERGFRDRVHPDDVDRSLPLRPVDDARMPPPRDRSPPPSQNGYRPNIKRGSSLLERLNLNDVAPGPDGGASLRDRVELAPQGSGDGAASAQVEPMEVDAEGNGNADDAQRAGGTGRGSARRRTGKSRRPRRNGGS
ncbi:hypothetical protein BV20DRAFT_942280 [Pilatotrama ljubarskyi]|nr:hypothetical protein BV20DRAFT_942280 [Pilatotrama ljubarskyi]